MRIIAGKYRGRRLFVPAGLDIRPTADRVKEALFSILGASVEGASVLDLFAGAGSLGLEAISRGADRCLFVDQSPKALAAVKRNADTLGVGDQVDYLRANVIDSPARLKGLGPFDLIFMDPPYGRGYAPILLQHLADMHLAAPEAIVAAETEPFDFGVELESDWKILKKRRYGQTEITLFSPAAESG